MFLPGGGQYIAAWRHPGSPSDGATNFDFYPELAKVAGALDQQGLADPKGQTMTLQNTEKAILIGDGRRSFRRSFRANVEILNHPISLVGRFLSRYGVLLGFLLLWQVASHVGWFNSAVLPPLDTILVALWNGVVGGALLDDIAISLQRSGIAFLAAVVVAIPIGLFMGQIRAVDRALDPILQLFRQTSALALYPVFILLLGLGEASKVFVIFWATLFPLLLNTTSGVKEVDPKLIEMARVYGASRLTVFRRVVIPAAIPSIFVGLRLSATTALLLLIASEMIGANSGIGFQVMNAQYNFQIPLMFAAIFLLALLGLIVNYALVLLQKRLCQWSEVSN
ncbi:sulfonate transport system permease protein [Rhizobium azooxidifex]|uniref:Sulfonate transport system permease protein n=2 Tax=Mycoplana azooxidifex TaxID=1636188 RepID=A0A7W6GJK9_9HYPH|nr:sulfonate transport system permease protein [Mycoplana azooxidifex]